MSKKITDKQSRPSAAAVHWKEQTARWRQELKAWRLHGILRAYRTLQDLTRSAIEFDRVRYACGHAHVELALERLGGWDNPLLGEMPDLDCAGDGGVELGTAARASKVLSSALMLNGLVGIAREIRRELLEYAELHGPAAARSVIVGAGGWDRALMGDDPLSPTLTTAPAAH